jgi:hypothetical protein
MSRNTPVWECRVARGGTMSPCVTWGREGAENKPKKCYVLFEWTLTAVYTGRFTDLYTLNLVKFAYVGMVLGSGQF